MAKIKLLEEQEPPFQFEGRDDCIAAIHDALRRVKFNFQYDLEDGENPPEEELMDLTLGDAARQLVDELFGEYFKLLSAKEAAEVDYEMFDR